MGCRLMVPRDKEGTSVPPGWIAAPFAHHACG
jgi:hypothetical protein